MFYFKIGNKYAVGNKGGRPSTYKEPEELQKVLQKYFDDFDFEDYTISGLILASGLGHDTFYQYGKKPGFDKVVKAARKIVENSYEVDLKKYGRAGSMFALKNIGKWQDKREIKQVHSGNISLEKLTDEELDAKLKELDA